MINSESDVAPCRYDYLISNKRIEIIVQFMKNAPKIITILAKNAVGRMFDFSYIWKFNNLLRSVLV